MGKTGFTFTILLSILFLISIYLMVKFLFNFKSSIKKTKEVLGKELFIPYVQGFNLKSSSFYNILLINFLTTSTLLVAIILLVKDLNKNSNVFNQYSSFYLFSIIFSVVLLILFNSLIWIIRRIMFNEPCYKNKSKNILEELRSLKQSDESLQNSSYPEKINLDVDKMQNNHILATNTLFKFTNFYNNIESIPLKKQYLQYLSQIFKIDLFTSSLKDIENGSDLNNLDYYASIEKPLSYDSKISDELVWMDKIDKKVEIIKENKAIQTEIGEKEFNKKYDDYINTIRSQDPNYSLVQKNTWLTYRDYEFEDLFYNPHSKVYYSIDDSKEIQEKPLDIFLQEYKQYLRYKFYKNK